jgi:hypothetical protein
MLVALTGFRNRFGLYAALALYLLAILATARDRFEQWSLGGLPR